MSEQNLSKVYDQTDNMSVWLFGRPPEGGKRRPHFHVDFISNNVRLYVKTNVENDANNGRIDFNCDFATFFTAMGLIRKLAEGKAEGTYRFTYEDNFVAGKKLDNIITISEWFIGKNKEGEIFTQIRSTKPERPRITFVFGPAARHNLYRVGGDELSRAELSCWYATGWAKTYENLVASLLHHNFNPFGGNVALMPADQDKKPKRNGGGGGNRNSGGNYRGKGGDNNYQSNNNSGGDFGGSDDFDDFDDY